MDVAGQAWCHFDWWFVLVAVAECEGDLESLRERLEQQHRRSLSGRTDIEAKLSHLRDLAQRLSSACLDATSLAGTVPPDKATAVKARRKVLTQALESRAMTEPMRYTPAVLLHERARFGGWEAFPSDPQPWFDKLRGARPVAFASKGQTFDRARHLKDRLSRLDSPRPEPLDQARVRHLLEGRG